MACPPIEPEWLSKPFGEVLQLLESQARQRQVDQQALRLEEQALQAEKQNQAKLKEMEAQIEEFVCRHKVALVDLEDRNAAVVAEYRSSEAHQEQRQLSLKRKYQAMEHRPTLGEADAKCIARRILELTSHSSVCGTLFTGKGLSACA